jgi:hypothetical protein
MRRYTMYVVLRLDKDVRRTAELASPALSSCSTHNDIIFISAILFEASYGVDQSIWVRPAVGNCGNVVDWFIMERQSNMYFQSIRVGHKSAARRVYHLIFSLLL